MVNDNTEQAGDNPLIEEPEDKINTLRESFRLSLEKLKPLPELNILARKTYPYTVGLMASFWYAFKEHIIDTLRDIVKRVNIHFTKMQANAEREQILLLKDTFGYSDTSIGILTSLKDINSFIGAVAYFGYVGIGTVALITAELLNLKNKVVQRMNKENPVNLPDVNAILSAHIKQLLNDGEANEYLKKHGFDVDARNVFLDAVKRIPDIEILFQNLWRGKITGPEMNQYLAKLAFNKEEQVLITNLAERIPPIQDLIRFSVREAFHEGLSAKYRHDEEFPQDVADWAAKQGFPEHWAKKYWRAHWELPSVQMAFEMMHRAVKKDDGETFVENDIDDLLKMADYAPSWRKLLTQISYRVITRVDARRMYDLGVWDKLGDMTAKEKLLKVYMAQGYNREDAGYMVDFTEQYHIDRRRGFTKAGLKKIYKYGIITETTFREKLGMMRIRPDEIDFLIDEANYEMEDKKLDSFMDMCKAKFLNNRWNESDVQLEMLNVDLHVSNPENLFESWRYEKQAKRRQLTKADILRLVKKGIIGTSEEAVKLLEELGYKTEIAELLINEIITDIAEEV